MAFSGWLRLINAKLMVMMPTLPKNIYTIRSSLEPRFSPAVIPVLSPTVQMAETDSYRQSIMGS
jgi:hypothetical protein